MWQNYSFFIQNINISLAVTIKLHLYVTKNIKASISVWVSEFPFYDMFRENFVVIVEIYTMFLINFVSKTNINMPHQTLEINTKTTALHIAQAGLHLLLNKRETLNLKYQQ